MKGHFRKRGCICPPCNCTCGRKWSFIIDVGKDPKTSKRKQASRSGFNTLQEAEATAAALITDINKGTFIKESDEEELPAYFEKEELAMFLNIIRKTGLFLDAVIFTVLAYTGMRVGELVALKWKNVDFNKHTIHITNF